jgi:hypothetical protein
MSKMTNRERTDLISLCKQRARVAKQMAGHRAAELMADFEARLATEYAWDDDETWAEAHRITDDAIADANAMITQRCRDLGIPKRFAPSIDGFWRGRGENASKQRREELRRVARTRIDAMTKGAQTQIDRAALEVQTYLVSEGLESAAARQFLESGMPTVESLMPSLAVPEVEKLLGPGQ